MPPAPVHASAAPAAAGAQASHAAIADVDSLFSSNAAAQAPAAVPRAQLAQAALSQVRAPAVQQASLQAGYELQAGTFPTQAAADHFAASLTGDGLPEVQPFNQGGQTAYRVVVHGLSSPAQAAAAKSEAMALGSPNPKITTAF
jgi:anti-sigma factor RsiW